MERWIAVFSAMPDWQLIATIVAMIFYLIAIVITRCSLELAGATLIIFATFRFFGGIMTLAKKGLQVLRA
jgi:hypothetical protein